MGYQRRVHGEFKSENLRENNQAKPQTKEEKMALNINTFSPFSMRSPFDDSFFSNRWNNDWMVPSKNLDSQFKEFRSLFNKEDGGGYIQRSFSRSYTLPKEAEADKMVSNLSSEGILVITTPKSAPALTDATHEAK